MISAKLLVVLVCTCSSRSDVSMSTCWTVLSRSSRPPPCRDLFGPQPHPTTPSAGSDSLRLSFQGGSRPRHLLCCPLCCLNHPGMIHACKFRLESRPLTPPSFHPSPLPVRPQITPPGPASSTPVDQLATARPDPLLPCTPAVPHAHSLTRTVSGQDPVPQALSCSLRSHTAHSARLRGATLISASSPAAWETP